MFPLNMNGCRDSGLVTKGASHWPSGRDCRIDVEESALL